ncbi:DUF998 domain-containing protein [Vulcanisaeta sp. JCM 16159]|uniref:DUF998 domain-containing protein n=1 Tax=Vulcanisaeta sp. JCM 16159 TaxID=1295371 RepID=UPI0006D25CCC|nr:DUF998 domain-containing protein [Vulcanisaeta sp. JCM 16159]
MGAKQFLTYTGIIAAVLAWLFIAISISVNPWFIFTKNAFSDLGGPYATDPWIYNYGLIITSIFIDLYSINLLLVSRNKVEDFASAFVFIAGLFLALIGIYHEGTRPHVFVSTWFFTQMDIALITWGIGSLMAKDRRLGLFSLLLGIIAPLIALIVPWPSAATEEAYGIVVIDLWVALMTYFDIKHVIR